MLSPGRALGAQQTQSVTLAPGWNAVWLEVSPLDSDGNAATIESVFTNDSISVIARPVNPVGTSEFISNPKKIFNQESWITWHKSSVSGNSLTTITGNQAYLVLNSGSTEITQSIAGEVRFFETTWLAANYNLVGFNLTGAPTFGEFFGVAGESGGIHPVSKIFTLNSTTGEWEGVQSTDIMNPGTAYWVFSERNSTFSGPVAIRFDGIGDLSFGTGPGNLALQDFNGDDILLTTRELTFTNTDDSEHAVNLVKISPASDELALYHVVPEAGTLDYTLNPGSPLTSFAVGTLASATTKIITLGADRNWSSDGNLRENLYRIEVAVGSSGAFQYFWLPTEAGRSDSGDAADGSTDSSYAGLWVGQANLNTVTSIAESGAPEVATTATLPIQVILHVDATGAASLLSHVIFMRTKTADETVPSEPVLVVDESKIPFFEGIEEKEGKLVGRRLETAAYDMPLSYKVSRQPNSLLTVIAESNGYVDDGGDPDPAQVTDEDLETYTLAATSRPAGFVESYALSWPLTGAPGSNKNLRTATDAPLRLDPFHRSNPFRHTFHPNHGIGFAVSRTMNFTFDSTNEDSLLTGTFTESYEGLTALATPLVASGVFTLRRLSTVSEIQ